MGICNKKYFNNFKIQQEKKFYFKIFNKRKNIFKNKYFQEVLNESFDAQELQQLDELHTSRITRILTNDFPMYFAVVTRVRQEVGFKKLSGQ